MAAMKLESNFRAVEEDFGNIIAASKQTLQKDKEELERHKNPLTYPRVFIITLCSYRCSF